MKRYKTVDEFIAGQEKWQTETVALREILNSTGIEETVKWGMPVYVVNGKNVFGIFATKTYFGIWFYQGALLTDKENVLINAQAGKTKAMRQWRFSSQKDLKVRQIKQYLIEAIRLAEAGKAIKAERNKPINIPPELSRALAGNAEARKSFDQLSKSCRREYAQYISEAKREETKARRIEKIIPMMLQSEGLNDKYR